MTFFDTDTKVETVTSDNYIDVKWEYTGLPDENGLRLRTRDVWYATKPTVPEFHVVDKDDAPVPDHEVVVDTAWTIGKAGLNNIIIICDRDDINGLRALLNSLESEFDRRDMDKLHAQFNDADEESDNNDV